MFAEGEMGGDVARRPTFFSPARVAQGCWS